VPRERVNKDFNQE